ncbi:hypothetical protein GCM10028805_38820 [Spirosoma harenae]
MRLLGTEKRDIWYVCLYAMVAGLISLSLPLGVQAVFNLVSSGMVFSSVYVLIALVVVGVIIGGLIQIGQQALVEVLEQRLFAKAAMEFTYRLPRIKPQALNGIHPPELMNRFFDVLTIQKGMPKLLIDLIAAAVQILFGILLLSFYHPVFLAFGLFTLIALIVMVWILGPSGLRTSLSESKYKYKMAAWLEDIANRLSEYRNPQRRNEPLTQTDEFVGQYLIYRNQHFQVLKRFYYNALAFKAVVTGGLLILGTALVVDRQMTLGQFVAAELVIVLITSSVEKLIMGINTIFDMLTAVEKMGTVTDLPLDDNGPETYNQDTPYTPALTPVSS